MLIKIDNQTYTVKEGSTVAAALMSCGLQKIRSSINGQARLPFCGMGICYECRANINGVSYERSCMVLCSEGMEINTL
ncbi:MAG: (2Fe-2S)-binding protein [Lentisphaeraceae bacterium]|nr:(2Fe-2S)-binding protein [Lentisphaeraceae bacterium]